MLIFIMQTQWSEKKNCHQIFVALAIDTDRNWNEKITPIWKINVAMQSANILHVG